MNEDRVAILALVSIAILIILGWVSCSGGCGSAKPPYSAATVATAEMNELLGQSSDTTAVEEEATPEDTPVPEPTVPADKHVYNTKNITYMTLSDESQYNSGAYRVYVHFAGDTSDTCIKLDYTTYNQAYGIYQQLKEAMSTSALVEMSDTSSE